MQKPISILALLALQLIVFSFYHIRQNKRASLGGKITRAKTYWLGYAMFYYFIIPVWIYFNIILSDPLKNIIFAIIIISYLRLIVQGLLMFVTKSWKPPYGIFYNLLSATIIGTMLILNINQLFSTSESWTTAYITTYILILFTDTYYAHKFHKIIGDKTKGNHAIWFASTDERFNKINNLTFINNIGYTIILILLIVTLIIKNDLF